MTVRALRRIEIDCDDAGCVVVGVRRDGGREVMSPRLSPYVAREHALGKGEFFNCDVVNRDGVAVVSIRTSKIGDGR